MHHGEGLRKLTGDDDLVGALADDYRTATLPDADRAMLDFADKLTRTPAAMQAEDVAALRGAGFDDRAIHDVVLVVGYFAFVNRVANGLGVALEPKWDEGADA